MAKFSPIRTGDDALDRVQDAIAKVVNGHDQLLASMQAVYAQYGTSNGQSLPDSAETIIDYNVKSSDTHNAVTSGSGWRFTVPVAGPYLIVASAQVPLPASTAYTLFMDLRRNGEQAWGRGPRLTGTTPSTGAIMGVQTSAFVVGSVGDTLQVRLYQASGGTRYLENNPVGNHIEIVRLPGS